MAIADAHRSLCSNMSGGSRKRAASSDLGRAVRAKSEDPDYDGDSLPIEG